MKNMQLFGLITIFLGGSTAFGMESNLKQNIEALEVKFSDLNLKKRAPKELDLMDISQENQQSRLHAKKTRKRTKVQNQKLELVPYINPKFQRLLEELCKNPPIDFAATLQQNKQIRLQRARERANRKMKIRRIDNPNQ